MLKKKKIIPKFMLSNIKISLKANKYILIFSLISEKKHQIRQKLVKRKLSLLIWCELQKDKLVLIYTVWIQETQYN